MALRAIRNPRFLLLGALVVAGALLPILGILA
jgi:hypothetical protein